MQRKTYSSIYKKMNATPRDSQEAPASTKESLLSYGNILSSTHLSPSRCNKFFSRYRSVEATASSTHYQFTQRSFLQSLSRSLINAQRRRARFGTLFHALDVFTGSRARASRLDIEY